MHVTNWPEQGVKEAWATEPWLSQKWVSWGNQIQSCNLVLLFYLTPFFLLKHYYPGIAIQSLNLQFTYEFLWALIHCGASPWILLWGIISLSWHDWPSLSLLWKLWRSPISLAPQNRSCQYISHTVPQKTGRSISASLPPRLLNTDPKNKWMIFCRRNEWDTSHPKITSDLWQDLRMRQVTPCVPAYV